MRGTQENHMGSIALSHVFWLLFILRRNSLYPEIDSISVDTFVCSGIELPYTTVGVVKTPFCSVVPNERKSTKKKVPFSQLKTAQYFNTLLLI